jgi:hypothetical protein
MDLQVGPSSLVLSAIPFMTMAIRPEGASGILLFIAVADGLGSWAMGYLLRHTRKVPQGRKQRDEYEKGANVASQTDFMGVQLTLRSDF